jgi:hypothetical protein
VDAVTIVVPLVLLALILGLYAEPSAGPGPRARLSRRSWVWLTLGILLVLAVNFPRNPG